MNRSPAWTSPPRPPSWLCSASCGTRAGRSWSPPTTWPESPNCAMKPCCCTGTYSPTDHRNRCSPMTTWPAPSAPCLPQPGPPPGRIPLMDMLNWLLEPLQYGFLTRALLVTVAAAVVCSVLSCWLILMGWSLMGDAVSHAVLPGVALAYIAGIPFSLGAFVFGAGAVALIGAVRGNTKLKADTAIGVVFTGLFAAGLAIISKTPSQIDLQHILFGNVLGVTTPELVQVLVLGALTLAVLLFKRRDLTLFAF